MACCILSAITLLGWRQPRGWQPSLQGLEGRVLPCDFIPIWLKAVFNPNTQEQRKVNLWEFETSMVYGMCFRMASDYTEKTCLEIKLKKKKKGPAWHKPNRERQLLLAMKPKPDDSPTIFDYANKHPSYWPQLSHFFPSLALWSLSSWDQHPHPLAGKQLPSQSTNC